MKKKWSIIVFGLLVSLAFSKLFLINPLQKTLGDNFDNYEYFGFQYLVKENILAGKYPLAKTDTLRYPVGFELATGYDGALAVFTGAILGIFMPQPLAFNLSIIVLLFVNFFLSYLLFKKLSQSQLAAVLAATIYGLSPYVAARISSHLNLAFIGGFPLFLLSLIQIKEKFEKKEIKTKDLILVASGVLLVGAGSLQYLIILTQVAIMAFIIMAVFYFKQFKQILAIIKYLLTKAKKQFFLASLFFILSFIFFFSGYLQAIASGTLHLADKTDILASFGLANPTDILIPNQYLGSIWGKINPSPYSIERVISPGLIEWFIFSLILIASPIKIKLKAIIVLAIASFVPIALGIVKIPLVPEGGRFIVVLNLILASLAIGWKKINSKKGLMITFISLVIIERFFFQIHFSPLFSPKAAEVIQNLPGKAVLNVPASGFNAHHSILPYFYKKKITDGYFHFTADTPKTSRFLADYRINPFICSSDRNQEAEFLPEPEETLPFLKNLGIETVVVLKGPEKIEYYSEDQCAKVREYWNKLTPKNILYLNNDAGQIDTESRYFAPGTALDLHLIAQKDGLLALDGVLASQDDLEDIEVSFKGEIFKTESEKTTAGIVLRFKPTLLLRMKLGERVKISSSQSKDQELFLTLFYRFVPEQEDATPSTPIEQVYLDEEVTVYQIH